MIRLDLPSTTASGNSLASTASRLANGQPFSEEDITKLMLVRSRESGEKRFQNYALRPTDPANHVRTMIDAIEAMRSGQNSRLPHDWRQHADQVLQALDLIDWIVSASVPDGFPNAAGAAVSSAFPELATQELLGWIDGLTRALLARRAMLGMPALPEGFDITKGGKEADDGVL